MVPDGTIATPDLQHIAGFYRGITIDPPVVVDDMPNMLMMGVSG